MDYFLHSMNWFSVFRHVMAAIIITVTNIDDSEGDCPEAYWDQPSKWCAYTLVSALEKVQPDEDIWNSDLRVNTTCTAWQQTNTCYQQLIKQCQANLRAVQELRMHVGRYWIYSLTCSSHTIRHNRHFVNCFLPHIKPTRICTEAFDRTFRNFVNDKQFRNACRVVHTAMNCFNEIKNEISERCSKDGAIEYQRNYIQPLVDQTRETVLSKCTLSPPDFNSAWSLQHSCSTLTAIVLVALLFARWRNLL